MKHFDIKVDRSSDDQALNGKKISKSELKPGDMVFFDTNGGHNAIEHAGIYIGDGNFIHASSGSAHKVTISNLNEGFYEKSYMWARRVIND
jgi:N-acetylmuramoyl-L-alanine amidase